MGTIYKVTLHNGQECRVWTCTYNVNGKRMRESTGTTDRREAQRFLDEKLGRLATGQPVLPRMDKITVDHAMGDLRLHYETSAARNLVEVDKRLKHLRAYFGDMRLVGISGATASAYVAHRQREGVSNGTINRELSLLGTVCRHAYANNKLLRVPIIRKLKEAAPRSGFFERDQYEAVRRHLPLDLQVAVTIAYTYGWRMHSEVLPLRRPQLDLDAGTLRLEPGTTKNDDGRTVYLTAELELVLREQVDRVRALERKLDRVIPFLFPRTDGTQRGDFRRAWLTAITRAGCPGMLRHDFRRTAVRNLVSAGVPERVAMTITGHKTRSVFDRYHIVSPADLKEAASRLSAAPLNGTGPVVGRVLPLVREAR